MARRFALLFLAALAACSGPTRPTRERPDIILVSLDTLRRDSVSAYGEQHAPMRLGRFADDALIFEQAYATTPFTLPAHISMFTGLHHVEHGVINKRRSLAPGIPTLTEQLLDSGYATVGLYSSEWLDPKFGFGRGFEHYEMVPYRGTHARQIVRRALEIIDGRSPRDQPFFLFLHFYDVHSDFVAQTRSSLPYHSPARYRRGLPGEIDGMFCNPQQECATSYLIAADRDGTEIPPSELRMIRDLYDRGVRSLSDDLRPLFSGLRRRGLYDTTMIVLTSDHGEEFREHGKFLHSQVYEESVAIPLLVKLPGQARAGERVEQPVTLMDLPSMALSTARGDAAGLAWESRDSVLFQDKLHKPTWGMRFADWKLVRDIDSGATELFHLSADPGERSDLGPSDAAGVERLAEMLEREITALHRRAAEMEAARENPESVLGPEEQERLRALGYVD